MLPLQKRDAFEEDAGFPDPRFPLKHVLARGGPQFNNPPYIHWHEALEILHVYRGVLFVRVGSASTVLYPGDALLIGSGFPHVISFPKPGPSIYSVYLFQPQMITTAWGDAYQIEFLTTTLAAEQRIKVYAGLVTRDAEPTSPAYYLGQLRQELRQGGPGHRLRARGFLLLALGEIHARYASDDGGSTSAAPGGAREGNRGDGAAQGGAGRQGDGRVRNGSSPAELARLQAALDYVKTHFHTPLTLEAVAASVNMSKYHFCREFRRLTGSTFGRYLRDVRLNHAIHMLLHTDKPVTDIALESGFASVSAFYAMFKQALKCTPGEVRRMG